MYYVLVIIFICIVLFCIYGNPKGVIDFLKTKDKPSKQEQMRSTFDELKKDLSQSHKQENHLQIQEIKLLLDTIESKHNDDTKLIMSCISELKDILNSLLRNQNKQTTELTSLLQMNNLPTYNHNSVRYEKNYSRYPLQMYSEMIDSPSPLGFYNDRLKESNVGCAFKILLNDEKSGTFQFVDDEKIQMEILSAFNPIVTDTSEYDNVPTSPTKIVIVEPGLLYLDNGIWLIKKKQIINFV